jgi:hypothetical protein
LYLADKEAVIDILVELSYIEVCNSYLQTSAEKRSRLLLDSQMFFAAGPVLIVAWTVPDDLFVRYNGDLHTETRTSRS